MKILYFQNLKNNFWIKKTLYRKFCWLVDDTFYVFNFKFLFFRTDEIWFVISKWINKKLIMLMFISTVLTHLYFSLFILKFRNKIIYVKIIWNCFLQILTLLDKFETFTILFFSDFEFDETVEISSYFASNESFFRLVIIRSKFNRNNFIIKALFFWQLIDILK